MKPGLLVRVLFSIVAVLLWHHLSGISTEHIDRSDVIFYSASTKQLPRLSIKSRLRPVRKLHSIKLTPEQQERLKRASLWYVHLERDCTALQVREIFEKYLGANWDVYHTDILALHHNYWHAGFQECIATFPEYEEYILDQYKQLEDSVLYDLKLKWHNRADRVIQERAQEIIGMRARHKQECIREQGRQKKEAQEHGVQDQCAKDLSKLEYLVPEYQQLHEVYEQYGIGDAQRMAKRLNTLTSLPHASLAYITQSYTVHTDATRLLKAAGINVKDYKQCYGNQLQQLIHQECIDIIHQTSVLPTTSPIYEYRAAIVDCADSARAYNQSGNVYHALNMADLCWTLLDYGTAVLEGVAEGVIGALEDMVEHPVHTLACVVASEYVLAYQLLKVTLNLAEIGITYAFDQQAGTDKWHDYTEPLAQLCAAVASKELTLRSAIKTGTKVATSMYAQHKMLKGLDKLYSTAQAKTAQFIADNPLATPQQYMATPEGNVIKIMLAEPIKSADTCPASCLNQYEKLKNLLKEEQYTSIVNCTKHGLQRLMERFKPEEVNAIIKAPDFIKIQNDGAKAFIKKFGEKYGIISINPKTNSVITGIMNIDLPGILQLGKNYGWSLM